MVCRADGSHEKVEVYETREEDLPGFSAEDRRFGVSEGGLVLLPGRVFFGTDAAAYCWAFFEGASLALHEGQVFLESGQLENAFPHLAERIRRLAETLRTAADEREAREQAEGNGGR